jgi:hypothetical protein
MAAITQLAARPTPGTDSTARSRYRTVGLALALRSVLASLHGDGGKPSPTGAVNIEVLRFQATRIRELAASHGHEH